MPPGVYTPAFHPKAKLNVVLIWQVFWLNPNLIAFPYKNSGRRIKSIPNFPFRGLGGLTATGIAPDFLVRRNFSGGGSPDFPFNPGH
jgi:hypothetical protein